MSKFKFNPKNKRRADRAEDAVWNHDASRKMCFESAQDLISDIFHLCDRRRWSVEQMIRIARDNWQAER
jgi:hypothetical protein